MGLRINTVKADAYLTQELAYLSRITGEKDSGVALSRALSLTAGALQKSSSGYVIQILRQSVGRDQYEYPLHPPQMLLNLRQRAAANDPSCGVVVMSSYAETKDALATIARVLQTKDETESLHYAAFFAHTVARQLQTPGGNRSLAYIDRRDRRVGYIAQTPYDRTLRNQFNRLRNEFQDWLKDTPLPPPEPPHTPPPPAP